MSEGQRSSWEQLASLIENATVSVDVLRIDADRGALVREQLRLSERSALGALVEHTGGLVIENGWLRMLAGGGAGLPSVSETAPAGAPPAFLTIAHDALGGRFAIDEGGLGVSPGEVCYWGPDTLGWTAIGGSYSAFVRWALAGETADFYGDLRWPGWQTEVASLGLDEGLFLYPPPFAEQGRDIARVSRMAVPLAELHTFYDEAALQLGQADAEEQT